MLPRLALPPSQLVLVIIALAFVAPGLVGHDPWRAFDVLAIEVVHQMHLSGDWLVPRIAGQPFLEDPPFYHWLALLFAKLFGGLLGFHNAVRLASGAAVLAACAFLHRAARAFAPEEDRLAVGAVAVLLLIGSIGLIVHAHEAVPDLAALTATCAALYFLAAPRNKPLATGAAFGAALGVAFLSTGFMVPVTLGATTLLACIVCQEWRDRASLKFLAVGAAVLALLMLSWPLALKLRAPGAFAAWWDLVSHPRGGLGENLRYYLSVASWYAWPAWPLAAWSAWTLRRQWRAPRVLVPLVAALVALLAIAVAGPQQDINATLLIAPLALLGAQGVATLRRGAANALDWFGVMTFAFFAGLVWLGYLAMMTGWPPKLAHNVFRSAPGFVAQFQLVPFLVALALTGAWLYLAFWTAPSPSRGVTRWAAGIALLWGCFATLVLPWADHLKSYRNVALQLRSVVPAGAACVAQREVGLPQQAAFSYHADFVLRPYVRERPTCPYVIVQGHPRQEIAPGAAWRKLADVGRPGDRTERYRLYRWTGK
jgi:4-amino-4-deoxy-L-arabinose transferase-like glycosyltransferase